MCIADDNARRAVGVRGCPERKVVAEGFEFPTQFTNGPDATLVVAQLAGEKPPRLARSWR
jgi:hypothetical protein